MKMYQLYEIDGVVYTVAPYLGESKGPPTIGDLVSHKTRTVGYIADVEPDVSPGRYKITIDRPPPYVLLGSVLTLS